MREREREIRSAHPSRSLGSIPLLELQMFAQDTKNLRAKSAQKHGKIPASGQLPASGQRDTRRGYDLASRSHVCAQDLHRIHPEVRGTPSPECYADWRCTVIEKNEQSVGTFGTNVSEEKETGKNEYPSCRRVRGCRLGGQFRRDNFRYNQESSVQQAQTCWEGLRDTKPSRLVDRSSPERR
jgi:hypothetical protein